MADDKYLGITFPFQNDLTGKYIRLNKTKKDEIRSQLNNLITTNKGERLFKPDFGINLKKFLFEPMDDNTHGEIRNEIINAVTKYMTNVKIEKVETKINEQELFIGLRILYSISDGIFKESDEINILF